ncbi:BPSS1187 family protein [Mucilaginibacter hurinus]|nr:hypothetical protein [Mucilaginibacter hurinus]
MLSSCKKEILRNQESALNTEKLQLDTSPDISILYHSATPKQTDAAITTKSVVNDPLQTAYLPQSAAARKDKLFIMIPGTATTPDQYDKICKVAAYNGYYALAIAYDNRNTLESYQGNSPSQNTIPDILEEFLTGQDASTKVTITKSNSFENRIVKMVRYLDTKYPTENWRRFLSTPTTPNWEKFIVSGHSQGSDHATYMAKTKKLYRVGFFGGPGNFQLSDGSYPAGASFQGKTPLSAYYGFHHTKDTFRAWDIEKNTWATINIPGMPNNVDDYLVNDNSHQLSTSASVKDVHNSTVQDATTPLTKSGQPLYRPVWEYMFFNDKIVEPSKTYVEEYFTRAGSEEICEKTITDSAGKNIYKIYYPCKLNTTYPLVTFGNGTGQLPQKYTRILKHLASWGFIVIDNYDQNTYKGQSILASALYMISENSNKQSLFYGKVNINSIGAVGHSQGGAAVINAQTNFAESKILKTIVPVSASPVSFLPYDADRISVPAFFVSGTSDFLSPLSVNKAAFEKVPANVQAVMGMRKGQGHEAIVDTYTVSGYVTAWLTYQLKGDLSAGRAFKDYYAEISNNPNWNSVMRKNLK